PEQKYDIKVLTPVQSKRYPEWLLQHPAIGQPSELCGCNQENQESDHSALHSNRAGCCTLYVTINYYIQPISDLPSHRHASPESQCRNALLPPVVPLLRLLYLHLYVIY